MKINKLLFCCRWLLPRFFTSCNNDDDNRAPLGDYDNGILVLNEGGLGTVTYLSNDLNTVQQDIFFEVNGNDQDLGSFAQSMFFDGDRAFIISGSNKITVVNRYTFEYITTLSTGFAAPRYGVVYNGKAYVTNSNSFDTTEDDFVTVINLGTLTNEPRIDIEASAERIIEANGKIYVSNGFFGVGNSITVINPATNSVVDSIDTELAVNTMAVENGTLYALCAGFSGPGQLVKINTQTDAVIDDLDLPESISGIANLDVDNGNFYFTASGNIYKYSLNATQGSLTAEAFIETGSTNFYMGYGFAVHDGRIYISEAADDFTSDGKIFIYDVAGSFIDDIPAGLGPNGFYFN